MSTFIATDTASTTFAVVTACGRHQWIVESLRGTNRHHRVETVRCAMCGERRRRVWESWNARHQYRGWKALPSTVSGGPHAILARHAGVSEDDVRRNPTKVYRIAARSAHPDAGGSTEAWREVQEAANALGVG